MKILLSHQPVVVSGGAERATLDLGAALRDLGHQVFLWGPWDTCPEFVAIAARGGITILPCDMRSRLREMSALRTVCRQMQIDVVLSHGRRYNALTPFAVWGTATKHVPVLRAQVSTWDEPRNKSIGYRLLAPPWNRFWIQVLKGETRILCVSGGVAADCQGVLRGKPSQTIVIHDAIGICVGQAPGRATEKSRSPFRLVLVGRLQPVKRFDMIVPLMNEILRLDDDVCADIAGTGECGADIEQAIRRAGLSGRIRLLGHREDMAEIYNRAHVLVHFCSHEGFARVYLESQQFGLPVVCVRGGGTAEAVCDGRTGFLHERSDVTGMAQSVLRLKNDTQLYSAFSRNACEWVQQFSARRMAEQYEAVFKAIVACRPHSTTDHPETVAPVHLS